MAHKQLKEKAIQLRKKGYSYTLIAEKLNVSKSTLHEWLPGVPYMPNAEVVKRIGRARALAGKRVSAKKRELISEAAQVARKEIGALTKRDLFMLGIAIYIGEGLKYGSFVRVVNADPRIIKLAVTWFTDSCGVPKEHFSVKLHLYPDSNQEECHAYWSRITGIPKTQFTKPHIDIRKNKSKDKQGKLPYGTAHLSIQSKRNILYGTFLRHKIDAWMDMVLGEKYTRD